SRSERSFGIGNAKKMKHRPTSLCENSDAELEKHTAGHALQNSEECFASDCETSHLNVQTHSATQPLIEQVVVYFVPSDLLVHSDRQFPCSGGLYVG
ncbi:hypothetical protein PENTCL1PPCAC_2951, partial [Pristionchus entomophagus]